MTAWRSADPRTMPLRTHESHSASTVGTTIGCSRRHEIANLSNEQIESLSNPGLIDLIRASEHPWNDGEIERHLMFADRSTLLRLAYLVRNCCRNAKCAERDQAVMDELDRPQYRRDAGTLFGNPR